MHFDAQQLLGTLLAQQGDYVMALGRLEAALRINPTNALVHKNRGQTLLRLGRTAEALGAFEAAVRLQPDYAEAHFNRGNTCRLLQRPLQALHGFDEAIRLQPQYVEALSNRGAVLQALGRFDEAEASLSAAVRIAPDDPDIQFNHGNLLSEVKRFDEALCAYERAISLRPEFVDAHYNRALLLLLVGRLGEGWREYEWRLKRAETLDPARALGEAAWRGEQDIRGKRLLLYSEQGIGDAIQHLRYVPLLVAAGATVSLALPPRLWPVADMLDPPVSIEQTGEFAAVDLHCPLMSLPYATSAMAAMIPAQVPYLHADPVKVHRWQQRLGTASARRVGLVWSGSSQHDNDAKRSIPLQFLRPLLDLPVEWHSLQIEYRPEDIKTLGAMPVLRQHQEELADLSETAALVSCMDLVISVDTSIAHLAGALAKEVYIMLPWMPDYRWMLDRDDSPWYPTARLFRQPSRGDWDGVVGSVCVGVKTLIGRPQ